MCFTGTPAYIIVSPVRNEHSHLQQTIDSVAAQTLRPSRWIIVDDGSTDGTDRLASSAADRHAWITVVRRPDRGCRKAGAGVMEAFREGYRYVQGLSWDFLVKLDGDLSFEADYFEACFRHFAAESALGIAGGTVCVPLNGMLVPESKEDPTFHVRGATKIYRRACWEAIGGLIQQTGWDTLDEIKANMLGWTTRTLGGPRVVHHRPTGRADGSWKNWVKNGRANYIVGYHPLFMFFKCLRRLPQKPYGLAALGLAAGFWGGYWQRASQIEDHEVIRYLRRQQINRLLFRTSLWG